MTVLINKTMVLIFILCFFAGSVEYLFAQKTDTLSPLRDFVSISNGYKQMPLYLQLEMKNTTNFVTGENDTTVTKGEFYLRNENSYIRFGEFEQVINDSVALLVSDKLQQMMLYANAGAIVKRMKSMMGLALPDSSIRNLARKYTSSTELSRESSVIKLQSRAVIYGTTLPKETIELQYDVSKKIPQQVTTITRSLLRLDSLQYSQLQNEPGIVENLLTLEGSYFLVKELVTAYIYNKIEQASIAKAPVLISDRIMKNETGEYIPVKNYESYRLTMNE
jgi:uncharacterized beta-barrel protein YwiB (DUF1934 family)